MNPTNVNQAKWRKLVGQNNPYTLAQAYLKISFKKTKGKKKNNKTHRM